jgi:hypothetical protein
MVTHDHFQGLPNPSSSLLRHWAHKW